MSTALRCAPDAALGPATLRDVEGIHGLIAGFADRGLMLPRPREELYRHFREYIVVTDGSGAVRACGGLRVYSPQTAEIVGLAVDDGWRGRGYGAVIVEALLEEGRAEGIGEVFALTLEPAFFHGLGFTTTSRGRFPEKIRADCTSCPKRSGCGEVTVTRRLGDAGACREDDSDGREGELRVLPG